MKLFKKLVQNLLPGFILFLLLFIPLYPKIPLIDVKNTWVYVRVEDFLVLFALFIWFYLLIQKKITLKTPLTIPIMAFWIIGALATIHGVVIIFPQIAGVFPNVALLAYLRHIEYLSLFFVAYSAVKDKKFVIASIWIIIIALIGVVVYGFGQKYLSFPAYLTMNEEYAKGVPILISPLNRISSTFAGHYDLAAYLVLVIPILVSLIFGFKNILVKIFLALCSAAAFVVLLLTVSRISFFALIVALFVTFMFYKRRWVLAFTPIVIVLGVIFLSSHSSLLARFNNTVKEVDVLVDASSGTPIGQVRFEPRRYLSDKVVLLEQNRVDNAVIDSTTPIYKYPASDKVPTVLKRYLLPKQIALIQAVETSTGESLPQGSGYINLSLSPVTKRLTNFFYEYPPGKATASASVKIVLGDFLVKRASAYDLSFTTRFQGEWPNTLMAFTRNLFFGSGYGSVSLAVDNNFLRLLGETGLLGAFSFVLIFIVLGVYIKKGINDIDSPVIRSFILGFSAGIIGIAINATLIDVFEASKIAFQLWILAGIVVGSISLYHKNNFNVYKELKNIAGSTFSVITYLILIIFAIFSTTLPNYFIGDDFTWFRWAADCKSLGVNCASLSSQIVSYFTNSSGFFYRPGTKSYFLMFYHLFSLNQVIYHAVSVTLHLFVVILLFLIANKIFKRNVLAILTSLLFVMASGYLEIVLWISATGHLFSAVFILFAFLMFIKWYDTKRVWFIVLSIISSFISLAFYEQGIIIPFLCAAYMVFQTQKFEFKEMVSSLKNKILLLIFVPDFSYLLIRYLSHTHWFNGDYSYNLLKLPFNTVGNLLGYVLISLFGPLSYPFYEKMRGLMRENIPVALFVVVLVAVGVYFGGKVLARRLNTEEKKIILFGFMFTIISLLPFLGLGNITFRYSYLAAFGVFVILTVLLAKLFGYLTAYGKDIALASFGTIIAVFCLIHVIQAQQTIIEWRGAGEKVQRFLTSLDASYSEAWSQMPVDIYFINVPIKSGNAWVFPVGLNDAVWFASKSNTIHLIPVATRQDVPPDAYSSSTKWVFEFQPDGSLKRIFKETLDGKTSQ